MKTKEKKAHHKSSKLKAKNALNTEESLKFGYVMFCSRVLNNVDLNRLNIYSNKDLDLFYISPWESESESE